jgi:rare lipoprotein A
LKRKGIAGLLLWGVLILTSTHAGGAYLRAFLQRGGATHDIQSLALVAAHPSLPLGTRIKVTNLLNGRSIEATIIGRIVASGNRIIDLSEAAGDVLDMARTGTTLVSIELVRERPRLVRERSKAANSASDTGNSASNAENSASDTGNSASNIENSKNDSGNSNGGKKR